MYKLKKTSFSNCIKEKSIKSKEYISRIIKIYSICDQTHSIMNETRKSVQFNEPMANGQTKNITETN